MQPRTQIRRETINRSSPILRRRRPAGREPGVRLPANRAAASFSHGSHQRDGPTSGDSSAQPNSPATAAVHRTAFRHKKKTVYGKTSAGQAASKAATSGNHSRTRSVMSMALPKDPRQARPPSLDLDASPGSPRDLRPRPRHIDPRRNKRNAQAYHFRSPSSPSRGRRPPNRDLSAAAAASSSGRRATLPDRPKPSLLGEPSLWGADPNDQSPSSVGGLRKQAYSTRLRRDLEEQYRLLHELQLSEFRRRRERRVLASVAEDLLRQRLVLAKQAENARMMKALLDHFAGILEDLIEVGIQVGPRCDCLSWNSEQVKMYLVKMKYFREDPREQHPEELRLRASLEAHGRNAGKWFFNRARFARDVRDFSLRLLILQARSGQVPLRPAYFQMMEKIMGDETRARRCFAPLLTEIRDVFDASNGLDKIESVLSRMVMAVRTCESVDGFVYFVKRRYLRLLRTAARWSRDVRAGRRKPFVPEKLLRPYSFSIVMLERDMVISMVDKKSYSFRPPGDYNRAAEGDGVRDPFYKSRFLIPGVCLPGNILLVYDPITHLVFPRIITPGLKRCLKFATCFVRPGLRLVEKWDRLRDETKRKGWAFNDSQLEKLGALVVKYNGRPMSIRKVSSPNLRNAGGLEGEEEGEGGEKGEGGQNPEAFFEELMRSRNDMDEVSRDYHAFDFVEEVCNLFGIDWDLQGRDTRHFFSCPLFFPGLQKNDRFGRKFFQNNVDYRFFLGELMRNGGFRCGEIRFHSQFFRHFTEDWVRRWQEQPVKVAAEGEQSIPPIIDSMSMWSMSGEKCIAGVGPGFAKLEWSQHGQLDLLHCVLLSKMPVFGCEGETHRPWPTAVTEFPARMKLLECFHVADWLRYLSLGGGGEKSTKKRSLVPLKSWRKTLGKLSHDHPEFCEPFKYQHVASWTEQSLFGEVLWRDSDSSETHLRNWTHAMPCLIHSRVINCAYPNKVPYPTRKQKENASERSSLEGEEREEARRKVDRIIRRMETAEELETGAKWAIIDDLKRCWLDELKATGESGVGLDEEIADFVARFRRPRIPERDEDF